MRFLNGSVIPGQLLKKSAHFFERFDEVIERKETNTKNIFSAFSYTRLQHGWTTSRENLGKRLCSGLLRANKR
jgi:hypothetical protein